MPSRITNLAGFTTSLSSTRDLNVGVVTASTVNSTSASATSLNVSGVSTLGNIQISSGIITAVSGVITYFGDASRLTGISAGSSITDDTTTNSALYPLFTSSTSGILTSARVSSTRLTFNPSSSTLNVGTGVTITGSGNISIAGTISASGLIVPVQVSSFDPAIGSTTAGISSNIIINFNQTVGFGTTGFIEIDTGIGTVGGTLVERLGVTSARATLSNGGRRLTIDPTANFGFNSSFYITMSNGFVVANNNNFAGINTVGTAQTYFFTTKALSLGDDYEGGTLICQSAGVRWVVAPTSSQVQRSWYCRADAITTAQSISGCTGWFVPSCGQFQNPGYVCRSFWQVTAPFGLYWSNTEFSASNAWDMDFNSGLANNIRGKNFAYGTRAFRCVTY